jgi:biopolymer transport protein ExbD
MDFGRAPRRPRGESIVPMINVVFLLLVFFLMTATIAPPDPFVTTPPAAGAANATGRDGALYLSADGDLAFGAARGDDVFTAIPPDAPLLLRADAALPASELATVLLKLAEAGVTDVRLAAVVRP